MSISFTPSQTHIIALVLQHIESTESEGYSNVYDDLLAAYCIDHPTYRLGSDDAAVFGEMCQLHYKTVNDHILFISRAYARFRNEFESYKSGCRNMREVRKYHRILVDTLAPFNR